METQKSNIKKHLSGLLLTKSKDTDIDTDSDTYNDYICICGPKLIQFIGFFFLMLRPVQTRYTRTIQHSTLYDRHCIALLGKVFKRTIHGLYNHSTSMTKQRIVG